MNERIIISSLRELIGHEGGVASDGRVDPGWCCSEHAFIACLAFALLGKKMLFCRGELIILRRESKDGVHVNPHFFLVNDSSKVFDSSISFEEVEGISTDAAQTLPHIRILAGKDHPPIAQMHQKLLSLPHTRLFCYTAQAPRQFTTQSLRWISTTPFGSWLAERFGSQDGLWAKAAWFVAKQANGAPPIAGDGRDPMWDRIASIAGKDNEVSYALEKLLPK